MSSFAEPSLPHVLRPLISPILVGREHELAALHDAAANAPSLVVVEGEAGVGKTRLVAELLGQPDLQRHHRLAGRCQQLHESVRLAPFIQALRAARPLEPDRRYPAATGALRILLPELDPLPQPPRNIPANPVIERHLVFRGILDLLGVLGPAILVVEDAHWADSETVDFIRYLAGQLPPNLMLVVTYRREELLPGSPLISVAARLPLGTRGGKVLLRALSVAEVSLLVGAILGTADVSPAFAAFVHARTEGIPFAVEEVLRLMIDRHEIVLRNGRWTQREVGMRGIPTAIRDSVVERFGALSPEARRLLEAAAVLDDAVATAFLRKVARLDLDDAAPALGEALGTGLIVEDDTRGCSFRHALARDAVYESLSSLARQRLHLRAAREYERLEPGSLGTQAFHYRRGGEPRWLSVAEAAADASSEIRDHAAAVRLLADVLASGDLPAAHRQRVALKLAWTAYTGVVGDPRVIPLLQTIVNSDLLVGARRGELRFLLGFLLKLTGDASAAHEVWRRAVTELGSHPLAARVMTHLADPWVFEGNLDDHMMWLKRADQRARDATEEVRREVAVARATILLYVGDRNGRSEAARLALQGSKGEHRRLLLWAQVDFSAAAFNLGRYSDAAQYLATVREHADPLDAECLRGAIDTGDLMLDWATGCWEGLDERATRHMERTVGVPRWSLPGACVSAYLASARGNLSAVERLARGCLSEARAGGVIGAHSLACGLLARVQLDRGRNEQAVDHAMCGVNALAAKDIWVWSYYVLPTAVEALLACGRSDEVEGLIDESTKGLTGRDGPAAVAAVTLCRGQLAESRGDLDAAAAAYEDAERQFSTLPHPWFAAQARARQATVLLIARDPSGTDALNTAVAALAGLGATADIDRIRRTLRSNSIAVTPARRGGRAGYGTRLSPREVEVARMAAEGRTNPEIGRLLFLSPRTIEHHLTSVMHKFGVRSRVELANRLRELADDLL